MRDPRIDALKDQFRNLADAFKQLTSDLGDKLDDLRDGAFKRLTETFKVLSSTLGGASRQAMVQVSAAWAGINQATAQASAGTQQAVSLIGQAFTAVGRVAVRGGVMAAGAARQIGSVFGRLASDLGKDLAEVAADLVDVGKGFQQIGAAAVSGVSAVAGKIATVFAAVGKAAGKGAEVVVGGLRRTAAGILSWAGGSQSALEKLGGSFRNLQKDADGLKLTGMQRAFDLLQASFAGLLLGTGEWSVPAHKAIQQIEADMRELTATTNAQVKKLEEQKAATDAAYGKKTQQLQAHLGATGFMGPAKRRDLEKQIAAVEAQRQKKLAELNAQQQKARTDEERGQAKLKADHTGRMGQIEQQKKALAQIGQTLATVGSIGRAAFAGIVSAVVGLGALASPAMFQQFSLAMRDLGAVVGQMLLPVFDLLIKVIRGVADWIVNLSPATKSLVTALAFLALGFGVTTVAVYALVAAFTALNTVSGGILIVIGAVVTALAGLAYWFTQTESGGSAMASVWEALKPVWTSLNVLLAAGSEAFGQLATAMMEIGKALGLFDGNLLQIVTGAMQQMIDGLTRMIILFGVLAETMSNPVGFLALDKMFGEVERRFQKIRKEIMAAAKSSVGAAPGKASFVGLEQMGKNVAMGALEMGTAQQQAEEAKKKREEDDKEEAKTREEINAKKLDIAADRLDKIEKLLTPFIDGAMGPFLGAARRMWGL